MSKKPTTDSSNHLDKIKKSLSRRNRAEKRFRWYGRMAVFIGLAAVMVLFTDIISKGHGAFRITYVELQVTYDQDMIGVENLTDPEQFNTLTIVAFDNESSTQRFLRMDEILHTNA